MNLWVVPSLATLIGSVLMGAAVLHRDPRSPIHRSFVLLVTMVALCALADFMIRTTTDSGLALISYKLAALGWILLGGTFLHFTLAYSKRYDVLRRKWFYLAVYGPGLLLLGLFLTTGLFITETKPSGWGLLPVYTGLFLLPVLFSAACAVPGFYLLFQATTKRHWELERKQAFLILMGGIMGWYGLVVMGAVPRLFAVDVPGMLAVLLLFPMLLISVAILKYKLFVLPPLSRFFIPTPEDYLPTKLRYKLEPGKCHLVRERRPGRSAEVFVDLTMHGVPGLWIASGGARGIRSRFGLRTTPVLVLNRERVRGEAWLAVTKLSRAGTALQGYASAVSGRAAIFFDCFSETAEVNGFEETVGFIGWLGSFCRTRGFYLIVRIDPGEVTKEQMVVIEKVLGVGKRGKRR